MIQQIAEQLEARKEALGISYYQIESDLKMSMPTVHKVFQRGKKKGKGYNVNNLLDIMAYMGMVRLTFDYDNVTVNIEGHVP